MAVDHPVTQAVRQLRGAGIAFTPHVYPYVERGGTAASAAALGVDEHAVVKTLVFEDEARAPLVILMHGDREVSQKNLARQIGKKTVRPCTPEVAEKHTGYQIGGTSPFGTRRVLPVYVEEGILALPSIYINGGARGFLVQIDPAVLTRVLSATSVSAATSSV